jgi:hypothetical protein
MDNIEKAVLKPIGTEMWREDRKAPYSEEVEKRRTGPSPAAEAEEEPEADRAEWRETGRRTLGMVKVTRCYR